MIKIGDFARVAQISVATLRYYDETGLLKPVRVDAFTGYRYYALAQMPRLNRILALKDLGFTLGQIEQVLSGGLTPDQLRGMLRMKHAEIERAVAEEQGRLARIETRLRQIEREHTMSDYEVVIKTTPPMLVASRRITIPTNDQVPQYLDTAYGEAFTHIGAQGAKPNGPILTLWHQGAEILENEIAEAAVPIDRAIPASADVKVYELPPVQVAAVVHHGNFDDFQQCHGVLLEWIGANGFQITGPYREIYMSPPEERDNATVEVQYPVARV